MRALHLISVDTPVGEKNDGRVLVGSLGSLTCDTVRREIFTARPALSKTAHSAHMLHPYSHQAMQRTSRTEDDGRCREEKGKSHRLEQDS